ncbi:MAG TPA: pirin family protein [Candidatus Limnocylindrales bacterium]|nr:pirin family protein [Candidatus Limnocylindrales bacterium]
MQSNTLKSNQAGDVADRKVTSVVTAHRQREGAGFIVRRPFPGLALRHADPFLLLDEMGPVDYAPGKAVGAPDHPHRGFETVTYVLDGEMEHEDSAGHRGRIGAGDVQWMTAGRGIVHSEMPSRALRERGGRMHGFQLWVNLPARDKMMAPRYQEVPRSTIPEAATPDGRARVRVIAGEALGASAVIETRTPIMFLHWTFEPGSAAEAAVPADHAAYVYVFEGALRVGDRIVNDGELALLGEGDMVRMSADVAAQALLLSGAPLGEPVVQYGPFVMNTEREIAQAIEDYRAGRLGQIARGA